MTTPLNPLDREAWEKRLKEIEARADAATPGPWNWSRSYELPGSVHWCLENPESAGKATIDYSLVLICDTPQNDMPKRPNWEFIAHARQDIPELVAYARALQSQLTDALAEVERLREQWGSLYAQLSHDREMGHGHKAARALFLMNEANEKARQPK